jgi:hypothetical protein
MAWWEVGSVTAATLAERSLLVEGVSCRPMPYRIAILEAGTPTRMRYERSWTPTLESRRRVFADERAPATGSQETRWHDGAR